MLLATGLPMTAAIAAALGELEGLPALLADAAPGEVQITLERI